MTNAEDLHGEPHVDLYLATDGADGYHWHGTYQTKTDRVIPVVVLERQ